MCLHLTRPAKETSCLTRPRPSCKAFASSTWRRLGRSYRPPPRRFSGPRSSSSSRRRVPPPGASGLSTTATANRFTGRRLASASAPWCLYRGNGRLGAAQGDGRQRRHPGRELDPGYMASLGLGYEHLYGLEPAPDYVSVSPFGQTGPKSQWPATELTLEAAGGRVGLQGDRDRRRSLSATLRPASTPAPELPPTPSSPSTNALYPASASTSIRRFRKRLSTRCSPLRAIPPTSASIRRAPVTIAPIPPFLSAAACWAAPPAPMATSSSHQRATTTCCAASRRPSSGARGQQPHHRRHLRHRLRNAGRAQPRQRCACR